MISSELLDILRCPETKAKLILDNNQLISTDDNSRRCYKIENDIPILLIEKSEKLSYEKWKEIMQRNRINIL